MRRAPEPTGHKLNRDAGLAHYASLEYDLRVGVNPETSYRVNMAALRKLQTAFGITAESAGWEDDLPVRIVGWGRDKDGPPYLLWEAEIHTEPRMGNLGA